MQEGADRGRRRHRGRHRPDAQGRRRARRQEGRAHRGRWRHHPVGQRRRAQRGPHRGQLGNRFRGQGRRLPGLCPGGGRSCAEPGAGRRGTVVGPGAGRRHGRGSPPAAGGQDRREHSRAPLRAPPDRVRRDRQLPARLAHRRAGRARRRRSGAGAGHRHARGGQPAAVRVQRPDSGRRAGPREGNLRRPGGRIRQAGRHPRQDGRGPACASTRPRSRCSASPS